MRLDAWLRDAERQLSEAGIRDSRHDARRIAEHALGQGWAWILAHGEAEAPAQADELLGRRLGREPLAYLLGSAGFYGREFRVGPGALIPRPETEALVDAALALAPQGARILDLGTGSGCLAATLALERPDIHAAAADLSPEALHWARRNIEAHGAAVELIESDLFSALAGRRFDLIVSNPPYVGRGDLVDPEAAWHEPELALYAEEDGLAIYRRLAREAGGHLAEGGCLIVEQGDHSPPRVQAAFEAEGWTVRGAWPDLGGFPRALAFCRLGA